MYNKNGILEIVSTKFINYILYNEKLNNKINRKEKDEIIKLYFLEEMQNDKNIKNNIICMIHINKNTWFDIDYLINYNSRIENYLEIIKEIEIIKERNNIILNLDNYDTVNYVNKKINKI